MYTSDITGNSIKAVAGGTIAAGAPVYGTSTGQVYQAQTANYIATNAVGTIVSATNVGSSTPMYFNANEAPVVRASNGNIFALSTFSTEYGTVLYQYSTTLSSPSYVNVEVAASGTATTQQNLALLSNGNLVMTYGASSASGVAKFAIYDQNLNQVVAPTSINGSNTFYLGTYCATQLLPLSGGGFAVFAWYTTTPGVYLSIFSNTGAVVLASTLIESCTSPANCGAAQLSNGNIVITWNNPNAALSKYAIYSATGSVVLATTSMGYYSSAYNCVISVLPSGYFAIGGTYSGTAKCFVYNNAGTLQGSAFTSAASTANFYGLVNDGTQFWLLYTPLSASLYVTNVPITGGATSVTYTKTVTTLSGYTSFSAVYDSTFNYIAYIATQTGVAVQSGSINLSNLGAAVGASFTGSSIGGAYYQFPTMISTGDGSVMYGVYGSNFYVAVGKYIATGILGVSTAPATAGNLVPIRASTGFYGFSSPLIGTATGVAFTATSSPITGSRVGTLYQYGVSFTA